MDIWAVAAVGFLAAGIYLPFLRDRFNLAIVSPWRLLGVAAAAFFIMGSLEARKYLRTEGGQGGP